MKLGFLSTHIKNFKTIRSMQFNFDRPVGVHLVCGDNRVNRRLGSNGAGKSSIFDALCWCLYGKTPDGKRGPDLVPWSSGGTIDVAVLTNDRHAIRRYHNPNKLTYDGKVVDQTKLDRLIGMSFDTFCHTMLLGQSLPLFFDLTPTAKMQLFNDVLDLERWTARSKNARKVADELQSKIDKLDGWFDSAIQRLEDLHLMLSKTKKALNAWDIEQGREALTAAAQLKTVNKSLATLQGRHDTADLEYDSAMTEIKPARREITQLEDYLRAEERQRTECTVKIEQLETNLVLVNAGKCPVCKRPLTDDRHKKTIKQRLSAMHGSLNSSDKAVADLNGQLKIQKKALETFQTKADNAREELDRVIPQLADAKAKQKQYESVVNKEWVNPHRDQMQDLRKKVKQLEAELDDKEDLNARLNRRMKRTEFWVKEFRNVELFLIDDVLQELEIATAIMLDQLGLIGWSIHYRTETETKAGTIKRGLTTFIKSPDNKQPVRWECWSGGEKQRLRIMGALALSEVLLARAGIEPTLEILDEPSSHLSPEGIADLVEFLANRSRTLNRTIFYVDQTVIDNYNFASTINVERTTKNGTVVQMSHTNETRAPA